MAGEVDSHFVALFNLRAVQTSATNLETESPMRAGVTAHFWLKSRADIRVCLSKMQRDDAPSI
jgi:hypothetical protein